MCCSLVVCPFLSTNLCRHRQLLNTRTIVLIICQGIFPGLAPATAGSCSFRVFSGIRAAQLVQVGHHFHVLPPTRIHSNCSSLSVRCCRRLNDVLHLQYSLCRLSGLCAAERSRSESTDCTGSTSSDSSYAHEQLHPPACSVPSSPSPFTPPARSESLPHMFVPCFGPLCFVAGVVPDLHF